MLVVIFPLLVDYLENPFELVRTNKEFRNSSKKCLLTLRTMRSVNPYVFPNYKWKNITLYNGTEFFGNVHLAFFDKVQTLEVTNCIANENGFMRLTNIRKLILNGDRYNTYSGYKEEYLKYMPTLEHLEVRKHFEITDAGLKYIPKIKVLLVYAQNFIVGNGFKHTPNIVKLGLWENKKMTDDGLKHLPKLKSLMLPVNELITDIGLKYATKLKTLYMENNSKITLGGKKHIKYWVTLGAGNCTYLDIIGIINNAH
jgi:hypothetical protein